MALLKVEDAVHKHDGNKLLPVKKELVDWPKKEETKEVEVYPLLSSEIESFQNKLSEEKKEGESDKEFEERRIDWMADVLVKKVSNPKLSKEDVKFMKPLEQASIIKTIMVVSGIPKEQMEINRVNNEV